MYWLELAREKSLIGSNMWIVVIVILVIGASWMDAQVD